MRCAMSKYKPLQDYLSNTKAKFIDLTFSDIEKILGFKLPPSSLKHRAWWSNNSSNNVMTEAWLNAGYETQNVDIESRRLRFLRANDNLHVMTEPKKDQRPSFASIFGSLKGQMIIMPEVDLTEPLWPEAEDDYDVFA